VVFRGFFDRFGRKKEEETASAVIGNDGWVEMAGGRLTVHDPAEDGRYATLTPETGVRLWVNDEEVTGPTAVTSQDQIRYEVAAEAAPFFDLQVADDAMSVDLLVLGDPHKVPDTVAIAGRHQVRLQPGYTTRSRPRGGNPRQAILDRLQAMGVQLGLLDEDALDREMAHPTGRPVAIVRGQEAQQPVQGQWVWKLDDWSLVEAGQVIAAYQGGQPNKPRIDVMGHVTQVYGDLPEPQVYLAGNGTRIVQGGRLVASASGRARALPTPQGLRVHIFPVHHHEGDLTGELELQADIIVTGNVIGAKVTTSGEFLVMGNVEKSEVRAEVITIRGHVTEAKLCTIPAGSCVPLRAEFAWLQKSMESMREAVHHHRAIGEEWYREVQNCLRAVRRKAEQMAINQPEYTAATEDLAKIFLGAQGFQGLDLPTIARVLLSLGKLNKAAEHGVGARDVRAASLAGVTVWAGRDVHVQEKVSGSSIFCGGAIHTPDTATLSHAELVAAMEVHVGILASVRGTAPVTIRAGGRIEAVQVQMGCAFEFGADRKEFKSDLDAVLAGINAKGQMIIKHKD
jgi:hypothetical protein